MARLTVAPSDEDAGVVPRLFGKKMVATLRGTSESTTTFWRIE